MGLYALSLMDREGEVHGYRISERIALRTDGGWRPGAGAVYPALARLRRHGWATAGRSGRRRVYTITTAGRRRLALFRQRFREGGGMRVDLAILMADALGGPDAGQWLLRRLQRDLHAMHEYLGRLPAASPRARALRQAALVELGEARREFGRRPTARRRRRGRS